MPIVYKVLTQKLHSATADTPKVRIKYSKTKVNKPKIKGSKIFAFKRLKDARNFISGCPDFIIYKAEASKIQTLKIVLHHVVVNYLTVKAFWEDPDAPDQWVSEPIDGTVLCDDLTLLKQVC